MLLHDFTPVSKPLILNKIMIIIDEPSIETPDADSDNSEEEQTPCPVLTESIDYAKNTENLFFRISEGSVEEEILIFDQLDQNSKIDGKTGQPLMNIGEAIITVNAKVQNDFQIRCYRNDMVEQ